MGENHHVKKIVFIVNEYRWGVPTGMRLVYWSYDGDIKSSAKRLNLYKPDPLVTVEPKIGKISGIDAPLAKRVHKATEKYVCLPRLLTRPPTQCLHVICLTSTTVVTDSWLHTMTDVVRRSQSQ